MLSLVRSGPTVMKITVRRDAHRLVESIARISVVKRSIPIESYSNASEGDTLIFLHREGVDEVETYRTTLPPATLLGSIIQQGLSSEMADIRLSPPNIVMRLIGDLDKAIDRIARDFNAREAEENVLMPYFDENTVLVNFTSVPLNRIVQLDEFSKRALLIDKPYGQLLVYLRAKAQEYLHIAMGGPDMNAIEITLFDAMNQFNLHYRRLITVLQGLDMGIVAGEDWVPEFSIGLRKTEVYKVRLLSPFSVEEVKQICLGLEYDENGQRVVDFDVYAGKKKIGWASEKKARFPGLTRNEIGTIYREKLLSSLPGEAGAFLKKLDAEIVRDDDPNDQSRAA